MSSEQDIRATRAFGAEIDFGRTASDYSRHRAGFPPAFFSALKARGIVRPGLRALDLGTGTGTIARGLARAGLAVTGVDPASALLDAARARDAEAGISVSYRVGSAEALEEADDSLDIVTAGQCWHWFDRAKAAAEVRRVLVPGGCIVIAHFDWLPLAGNVVAATEDLILKANPAWTMAGGTGLYPDWLTDLATAGFTGIETFSFDIDQAYSHEAWRGRIRASAGVKASLDADAISSFDTALAALLERDFPDDPLAVPHRVWAVTARRPLS